jgi:hypothetical protein
MLGSENSKNITDRHFKIVEKAPSKTTSIIATAADAALGLSGKADEINKKFIEAMSNSSEGEDEIPFNEKIQQQILKAIDNMFDKMKDNIYEKILEIIDKYTKFLLNEKQIKLQIFYSILSYKNDELDTEIKNEEEKEQEKQEKKQEEAVKNQEEGKEQEKEQGEKESIQIFNSINNTFFLIHKIFEISIKNFMDTDFNTEDNYKTVKEMEEPQKIEDKNEFIKNLCIGDNGQSKGIIFHLNKELMEEIACRPGSILCKIDKNLKTGLPEKEEEKEEEKPVASNELTVMPSNGGTKRRRKRKTMKKSKTKRHYHKKTKHRHHKKSIRK